MLISYKYTPMNFCFVILYLKRTVLGIGEGIALLGKGVDIVFKSYHWLPVRCFVGLPRRVFRKEITLISYKDFVLLLVRTDAEVGSRLKGFFCCS